MVKKRRGQSAAFMARIRKLRGKKKSAPVTKSIKTRRYTNMAKRRKSTVRRGRRSGAGKFSGIMATGVGIGAYILFESMIEPKLIAMANITNPLVVNAVELMAGLYLSRRSGVLGNVGKAAVVVNLYQILHPYLSGLSLNGASQANGLFN
jgi:hypothetical protein